MSVEIRDAEALAKIVHLEIPGEEVSKLYEQMRTELVEDSKKSEEQVEEESGEKLRREVREVLARRMLDTAFEGKNFRPAGEMQIPEGEDYEPDPKKPLVLDIPTPVWTFELTDLGACRKSVHFQVPRAEMNNRYEDKIEELCGSMEMPGFRRGKAPRGLVEKRTGHLVRRDVKVGVVSDLFQEVRDGEEFRLVGLPEFPEVDELPDDETKPFEFDVMFDIWPDVTLPEYKDIEVRKPKAEISDEEAKRQLEDLIRSRSPLELQPPETAIEAEDVAACSSVTLVDGEEVRRVEQASANLMEEAVGAQAVPGLRDKLVGAKPGDECEVGVTFGEDVEDEKLRGKEGVMQLKIKEVRRRKMLPLNAETAEMFGQPDYESLQDYFKKRLEERVEQEAERSAFAQIEERLLAGANFDLPESLVEMQTERNLQRMAAQMLERGISLQQVNEQQAQLEDHARSMAVRSFTLSVMLEKIADQEKIYVTEGELWNTVTNLARVQSSSPQAMWKHMEREGILTGLRREMRERSTMRFLLEKAKVEEVSVDVSEADSEAKSEADEGEGGGQED